MYRRLYIVTSLLFLLNVWLPITAHQMNLNMCTNNETVSVTIKTNDASGKSSCQCQLSPIQEPAFKVGYMHTPGVGSHKLHTEAKSWNDARKICKQEGGYLAIINSKREEEILVDLLKKSESMIKGGLNAEEALLGIHDLYTEGEWITIFGESIYDMGYYHWSPTYWGGQPDNYDNRQNCGAIINQGGMDDVDCRDKFAFFCELPIACTRS